MSPNRFDILLKKIENNIKRMDTNFRKSISAGEQLAITLRYLAHGDSQYMISLEYRVGHSTVSNIIKRTCNALWEVLSKEYLKVPDVNKWKIIAKDFETQWDFPNCLGAIDGKHINIQAPAHSGSTYFNYKGAHSLVLLAACSANCTFTIVDIGGAGRQSDGGTFSNSCFGDKLEKGQFPIPNATNLPRTAVKTPYVFIADEAFPLCENLLRPYPGRNLNLEKRVFNYRLSRARRVIENTFGILAARWRIFRKTIIASVSTVELIIKATICLHNYLKITDLNESSSSLYCPAGYGDYIDLKGELQDGQWRSEITSNAAFSELEYLGRRNSKQTAIKIRDMFCDYFSSEYGELPWQYRIVNRGFTEF